MNVLVTGKEGFVGKYLERLLKKQEKNVYGFDLKNGEDLRNYEQLRNKIDKIRPTEIYHLAAQAYVPESFNNSVRAFEINTIGSVNLLEAVKQLGIKTKVLLAGTSEEYGDVVGNIDEKSLPNPQSPYAISKLAMDYMGRYYTKAFGLHIIVTRAYNHAGAGRGEMYAESAWAKQIVEIESGKRKCLEHGNLETIRNYTDVRDIVKAYTLAIDLDPGVYNICSDNNVKMEEILDILIKNAKCEIKTKVNPALYRSSDFSFSKPSCEKLQKLTGWKPEIKLEETMVDILNGWRTKS